MPALSRTCAAREEVEKMKRNQFGVNLDEGIPLSSNMDFAQLYVACFGETVERLRLWMEEGDKPLLLGGQIGSGKSTLINKAFQESTRKPDVVLHFDRETLNLDPGDFWGIILTGFLELALAREVDLSFSRLPEELCGYPPGDWSSLIDALAPRDFSMSSFAVKKELRKKIAQNTEYIGTIVSEIGKRLQKSAGRPSFIFAAGLDKLDISSAAFLGMEEVVSVLSEFKTLFEVNAVHLFSRPGMPFHLTDRLLIPAAHADDMVEMLSRRMGVYAKPIKEELDILAHWSGGNPRQALRLLSHFETAGKNRNRSTAESITVAVHEATGDFFSYSPKPSTDLMNTIRRSAQINVSLFSLPGDRDTARRALYGNWIIITGMSRDTYWPVIINPLVAAVFKSPETFDEPEVRLLRGYAERHGISPMGLSLNRLDERGQEKSGDQLLWELLASGVEKPIHSNLTEMLDVMSGALLSKERADRVIIAYKDHGIVAAAQAYLFAKANSYEYQRCLHSMVEGGPGREPLETICRLLAEDADIFSFELTGDWEPSQLEALDRQRDRFLDCQMLWWISFPELKKYLPHWTQLRQLFEVFVLEDELLGSISDEEIGADMAFYEDLAENEQSAEANVVSNLRTVLEYLHRAREGEKRG